MKTSVIILLLSAALSCHAGPETEWEEWKKEYGKVYHSVQEEATARAIWLRRMDFIQSHNSRADVNFTLGMNEFGDRVFRSNLRLQHQERPEPLYYAPEVMNNFLPRAPPASFDWRTRGAILPVHNQGKLGSSDAFSVADDLAALHAIRTGQLVDLSPQEVVDCCSLLMAMPVPNIYECIAKHGGLCSSESYPSHGGTGPCRNDSCQAAANDAKVTVHIHQGDEREMVTAVLRCPLVVFVDAGHTSFQLYKAGVYSDRSCSHATLDHVMLLVGYGVDPHGTPYWILKNSWGTSWGMQGYMLLERGVNMCGVASYAFYPQ